MNERTRDLNGGSVEGFSDGPDSPSTVGLVGDAGVIGSVFCV